jgi:hypothetical protein
MGLVRLQGDRGDGGRVQVQTAQIPAVLGQEPGPFIRSALPQGLQSQRLLFASYTSDAILMVKTLKTQKVQPKIIWGQDAGFDKPEFRSTLGKDASKAS